MKLKLFYQCMGFGWVLMLAACSQADETSSPDQNRNVKNVVTALRDCPQVDLPYTTLDALGCSTMNALNVNVSNSYLIIRSQSEFDNLVSYTGDCPLNIDFSAYDLVIGKKQLTSGNQHIYFDQFTVDCSTRKLRVIFDQNQTMVAPTVLYHVLIPKLASAEQLIVENVIWEN